MTILCMMKCFYTDSNTNVTPCKMAGLIFKVKIATRTTLKTVVKKGSCDSKQSRYKFHISRATKNFHQIK